MLEPQAWPCQVSAHLGGLGKISLEIEAALQHQDWRVQSAQYVVKFWGLPSYLTNLLAVLWALSLQPFVLAASLLVGQSAHT